MQQQLQEIIKRFQQNYYHSQYQNIESHKYYDHQDDHQLCNQEIIKLNNKTMLMEQTIEALIYYSNRTHKFYQSLINQTITNFNQVKQQKNQRQIQYNIEIKEANKTIEQLSQQIEFLKKIIHKKQDNNKEISEKHQELIQRFIEVNQECERHIKEIQANFKSEMNNAKTLIESKEYLLHQCAQENKRIRKQIIQIKQESYLSKVQNQKLSKQHLTLWKQNETLLSQNQQINKKINSLEQKINDMLLVNQFVCEDSYNARLQQRSKTIKTNRSRDSLHQHEEKDTLNISEHYIQSIKSFQIKYDQSQEHIGKLLQKGLDLLNTLDLKLHLLISNVKMLRNKYKYQSHVFNSKSENKL